MKKILISCTLYFFLCGCNKDISNTTYTISLLSNKTWFLDYIIQENTTKSFIGKNTYFIQFSGMGKTIDSDGISGNYTIQENNKIWCIVIDATTQNGSTAKYSYDIEHIGSDQLIVSYQLNSIKTKKIFSTTH